MGGDKWGVTNGRKSVGPEIAPAHPAPRGAVWMRAAMPRGVHRARAAARRHDAGGRSCGGGRARGGGVRTGVAVRLAGEARKGFRLAAVLAPWWRGVRWC